MIAAHLAGCSGDVPLLGQQPARAGAERLRRPCSWRRHRRYAGPTIPFNASRAGPGGQPRGDRKSLDRRNHAGRRTAGDGARPQGCARHHRAVRLDDLPLLPPASRPRPFRCSSANTSTPARCATCCVPSFRSASSRASPPSRCRCAPPEKYFMLYDKLMAQQASWVSQEVRPGSDLQGGRTGGDDARAV